MYHMGMDQYGDTYHGLKHPRKDLLEKFGMKHAHKMYRDTKDGPKHVGYSTLNHCRWQEKSCLNRKLEFICRMKKRRATSWVKTN